MITYAEVQGTTLIKYPYRFSDLQSDNPFTNYGDNYDVAFWFPTTTVAVTNNYELLPVTVLPEPIYDPSTQQCLQNTTPTIVNGVWTLDWTVSSLTADQIAANLAAKREAMVVTPFQAKAALHNAGLLDAVTALINDPTTDPLVVLAWNNVTEFRRTSAMIVSLASKLNLSDTQLDDLFTAAAKITA